MHAETVHEEKQRAQTRSTHDALVTARRELVEYRDMILHSHAIGGGYVDGSDKAVLDAEGRRLVRPVRRAIKMIDQVL